MNAKYKYLCITIIGVAGAVSAAFATKGASELAGFSFLTIMVIALFSEQ